MTVWTFKVTRGEPFQLQPEGNPCVEHDGVMSVFHLILTDEQAEKVTEVALSHDCKVTAHMAEGQTEAQGEERRKLLGVGRGDKVWPSIKCPTCFWFDPLLDDNPCGYLDWNTEVIEEALKCHKQARADVRACPVGPGKMHGLEE